MKKNYIGIANSFHDSSVAIVNSEGEVVFAEAAERYLQNKRAVNSVGDQFIRIGKLVEQYCEPGAELVVAHTWSNDAKQLVRQALEQVAKEENAWKDSTGTIPDLIVDKLIFRKFAIASQLAALSLANQTLRYELSQLDGWRRNSGFTARCYDHHLTHAATACYTAPYHEGACAVIDGYGERSSSHSYIYRDGRIGPLADQGNQGFLGASLGMFYMIVCDVCGFGYFRGEEWKVMGLAAYGRFAQKYYDIMRPMLNVNELKIESCSSLRFNQNLRKLYAFQRRPGQPALEMADLAYTGQVVFSELLNEYLNQLHRRTEMEDVMLGGGCFLNSWANGAITVKTPFKHAYIFSAPADDGNSIGAALLAFYEDNPGCRPGNGFQTPYLGSALSRETIGNFFKFGGLNQYVQELPGQIHVKAAELLAQGKIIGWVQGRAEFGPRALGNRSILADPRARDCKERINARVKFREEFRPFAPAILDEFGPQYFEDYQESPYMERTLRFKDEVMERVPGVVHQNLTGRLQTVKREWNERFYLLLEEFYRITGVPVLLNTSFNVMGKPIIHSLEDAIAVFFTSGLDALVVDDFIIAKP
jgi:carbamoyltransferase